jgi:hypothetical protein
MTITQGNYLVHWNYFIALERDLIECSRYVEFSKKNKNTYSIEFSQLLFSASSEVDVIAKGICKLINPLTNIDGINNYQPIITGKFPKFKNEIVHIHRYDLSFKPWVNWQPNNSPYWWQSYNKVKHERNEFFWRANLWNTLRSLGALLIITSYYYLLQQSIEIGSQVRFQDLNIKLQPESDLLTLNAEYYYDSLVG